MKFSGKLNLGIRTEEIVRYPFDLSGASQLPRDLTINGTTVTASFVYDGSDITGTTGSLSWPEHYGVAGGTLTEATGGALTRGNAGPFTDGTTGTKGDGTGRFASVGDIFPCGTNDIVGEVIAQSTSGNVILLGYRPGVQFELQTSGADFRLQVHENGQGALTISGPTGPATGSLCHIMFFLDRNGSGIMYVNAVAGSALDISSQPGTFTGGVAYGILDAGGGTAAYSGKVYYHAAWHSPAWLDTHLQAAVAAERCAQAFGTYASKVSVGNPYPTITRASTRYFQVGNIVHPVGNGGHAVEQNCSGDRYIGVYEESTNLFTYSDAFSSWTQAGLTANANAIVGPFGDTTVDRCTENSSAGNKYLLSLFTAEAATAYETVVVAKGISAQRAISTLIDDDGAGNAGARVNPNTGVIISGANTTVEWIGSFCVIRTIFTSSSTPTNAFFAVFAYDTVTADENYTGDGRDCFYLAHAQICKGTYRHPLIRTAGTTAIKSAEVLSYPTTDFTIPGSVFLTVRNSSTVPTNKRLWSWYDADANGIVELYMDSAGHCHLRVHDGTSETVDIEVATAINNGSWHSIKTLFSTNYCRLNVDGIVAEDTSCSMPNAALLDICKLGSGKSGNYFDGEFLGGTGRTQGFNFFNQVVKL